SAVVATSATTGTGTSCDVLLGEMEATIEEARYCGGVAPDAMCDGRVILFDTCGCPTFIANENNVEAFQKAQKAYSQWVDAGCGPYPCEVCVPVSGPGACVLQGDVSVCMALR